MATDEKSTGAAVEGTPGDNRSPSLADYSSSHLGSSRPTYTAGQAAPDEKDPLDMSASFPPPETHGGSDGLSEKSAAYRVYESYTDEENLPRYRPPPQLNSLFGDTESDKRRKKRPFLSALQTLGLHGRSSYDANGVPKLRRRNSFFNQFEQEEDEEDEDSSDNRDTGKAGPFNEGSNLGDDDTGERPKLLRIHSSLLGKQEPRRVSRHTESSARRRKFILKLAKALLAFGAPSHRIESQLFAASKILSVKASFAYLPNIVLVSFNDGDTRTTELHFVRSSGRIALTSLHKVHDVYLDVLHDNIGATAGIEALDNILRAPALYPLIVRCLLAFVCASVICPLAFGGSFIDMWVSGTCACVLQYLGLQAAAKSSIYANVYEISVSIIVSLVARILSCIPGRIFCYSSISSAGVVLILPGFTILISALELTSRNILCGSVRLVYAIIYTFFLGFGLTIGSDVYLMINARAHHTVETMSNPIGDYIHGSLLEYNATGHGLVRVSGTFGFSAVTNTLHLSKGCYRDTTWPWYRQPFPWWTMLFLVPIYSTCSSLSNLQTYRSSRLPVMIAFSCCSYAANKAANLFMSDRGDIASAAGALVIGLLGNFYSRFVGGTAFTSMVTGVLFLVPSGLAQAGGLTSNYDSSAQQYWSSFTLGLRMVQVAVGVTIGLFVSQSLIYAFGGRKKAGHKFAF
ncbi:hypothetical protein EVG20_g2083 [Dentipellis fragilis]|uniref:Threonine/serine exporter-like N-terminal domain-containing protein n=1 Tax=Dentipellis fragilis TaxID=205917 RepID=A0A4Y9ZBZ5_9AGAM|nr:hypothetical protein EVG20_g2083 [Dentipellis fragilis]